MLGGALRAEEEGFEGGTFASSPVQGRGESLVREA